MTSEEVKMSRFVASTKQFLTESQLEKNAIYLIDNYDLIADPSLEEVIRKQSALSAAVIDLKTRVYSFDFILSPAGVEFNAEEVANPRAVVASGFEYYIISKSFKHLWQRSFEKRKTLICFGSADPTHISEAALKTIKKASLAKTLNPSLVCGRGFTQSRIDQIKEQHPGIQIYTHLNQKDLNLVMNQHTDLLCASSTICLEAAKTQLPSFAILTAKNQEPFLQNLQKKSLILGHSNPDELEDFVVKTVAGWKLTSLLIKSQALKSFSKLNNDQNILNLFTEAFN